VSAILTRTLPSDHTTPVRAYASLRSHAKGRSSFLLESAAFAGPEGRYSILGYRTKGEAMYPGIEDVFPSLASDLPEPAGAEGVAVRFLDSLVGFIAYDAAHHVLGIEPWPDEEIAARMMRDPIVAVFDHHAHTLTIAGRSKGALDRCEWEMTHGHDLPALGLPDPEAAPLHADPLVPEAMFEARAARAAAHVASGEVDALVLARGFVSPEREADLFDVYRALRVLAPTSHMYFLEYGETPFAPALAIAGSGREALVRAAEGAGARAALDAARAAFPHAATIGGPRARAAKLVRDLEPRSRGVFGGVVGYVAPDGAIDLAVASIAVVHQRSQLWVTGATAIGPDTDPAAAAAATRHEARLGLAAIRAAQDAIVARRERAAALEAARAAKAAAAAAEPAKG
jgi:anthranilate synthase component 1